MTGDIPPAALRLLSQLPVRTHERRLAPTETRGGDTTGLGRAMPKRAHKRTVSGTGRGGQNRRSVVVRGKHYASIREAVRKLGISNSTIYTMIGEPRIRK